MTRHPQANPTGIGAPGTEFGPCVEPCDHIACEAMKERAAEICDGCLKPIGYGRPFVENGPGLGCTCGNCLDEQADQADQLCRADNMDGIRAT